MIIAKAAGKFDVKIVLTFEATNGCKLSGQKSSNSLFDSGKVGLNSLSLLQWLFPHIWEHGSAVFVIFLKQKDNS